jgi:hypothetical protein
MLKSLTGIAAAATLTIMAAPAPADAAPLRPLSGLTTDHQANVEEVQYRRYRRYHRRYDGPYYYGPGPYAYGPRYHRYRYYDGPGVGVRVGPLGFGVW